MEIPDAERASRNDAVVFRNEPRRIEENALLGRFEKDRKRLRDYLPTFISGLDEYRETKPFVDFFQSGVSSFVMKVESVGDERVLKIPFAPGPAAGEAFALTAWRDAGVDVPNVLEKGTLTVPATADEQAKTYDYLFLEYVGAETLARSTTRDERLDRGIYGTLGALLRQMHTVRTEGWGTIDAEGEGPYATFAESLATKKIQRNEAYVIANGLMKEKHLSAARGALVAYEAEHSGGVLCHTDYGPSNTFNSAHPRPFDPAPESSLFYMDVGKAAYNLTSDGEEAIEQFLNGYEGKGNNAIVLDRKLVHAGVVLACARKLAKAHELRADPALAARIPRIQGYLERNEALVP